MAVSGGAIRVAGSGRGNALPLAVGLPVILGGVAVFRWLRHGHPRRPDDPVADLVAGLQDLYAGRLGDLSGVGMHQCFVERRVERVAGLAVGRQAELGRAGLQGLGHRLEAAGQFAVLPGPPDVIEHRQQFTEHARQCLLPDGRPVSLHALAVIGVLGLQPLQVSGPLGQPGRGVGPGPRAGWHRAGLAHAGWHRAGWHRAGLAHAGWHRAGWHRAGWHRAGRAGRARSSWRGRVLAARSRRSRRAARLRGGMPARPDLTWRVPYLTGLRVDTPAVPDYRALVLLVRRLHQAAPPSWSAGLSSSTISASTTSSSASGPVWLSPPSPAWALAACDCA